jgi:nitrate reductase NapE component
MQEAEMLERYRRLEEIEARLKSARDTSELLLIAAVGLGIFPLLSLLHVEALPVEIGAFGTLMWSAVVIVALVCRVQERRIAEQRRELLRGPTRSR